MIKLFLKIIKNIFRKNPYYYKDIVDEETGKVISGTKWHSTTSPTAVVDLSSLISKGLQWAARESGSYNQVRWLDKMVILLLIQMKYLTENIMMILLIVLKSLIEVK